MAARKGQKGKFLWKGLGKGGGSWILTVHQWESSAGTAGVSFPTLKQWSHLQVPGPGKGMQWLQPTGGAAMMFGQAPPAGFMLAMLRETASSHTAPQAKLTSQHPPDSSNETNSFCEQQATTASAASGFEKATSKPAQNKHVNHKDAATYNNQMVGKKA